MWLTPHPHADPCSYPLDASSQCTLRATLCRDHTGPQKWTDERVPILVGSGMERIGAPSLGREDRRGLPKEGAFRPWPENEKLVLQNTWKV